MTRCSVANVQKRPNGMYRARYRDPSGKEHARHFRRKGDAQAWLDSVTSSLVTGTYVDPQAGRLTFRQWWAQWSHLQIWARGTRIAADQAASGVPFGDLPMRAITRTHVQAWVKSMTTTLAASTVRTRYAYVASAFREARISKVIPEDPCQGIKLPKVDDGDGAMLLPSPVDVAAALDVAVEHFRPFVAVCAFAGLRLGEAAGLQVADVDFLRRSITVRRQVQGSTTSSVEVVKPKGGKTRTVPVPEELVDLLAAHVQTIGVRGEEQWLLSNGPDLWNRNSAAHQWRMIRRAADLPDYTLHDLRHFYASALIASGCDVVTVQRAMGHSSANITLGTYAHLWPTAEDRTREASAALMRTVLGGPADSLRTTGVQ